jgi:F0F1-type ATP synthase assembly protein I
MIVMIFFASFQASRDWGDLLSLLAVGAVGMLMKRYGWSRPAFLIGFVLSEQLEAAFYRTIQVYGFDFLTRPISLILLVLCGLSAALAWRNMQMIQARNNSQEKIATKVISKIIRRQHIMMASGLLTLVLIIIADVADLRFLSNAFPITVATITGGLLLLVIFRLLAKEPHSSLFEGVNEIDARAGRGSIYYFSWLGGIVALSAVFGFTIAAPLFVFIFLRYLGRAGNLMSTISAASISALLYLMQYLLVLEYPRGFLQTLIP